MRPPIIFIVIATVLWPPSAFADGDEDVVWVLGIIFVLMTIGFGSLFMRSTWKIKAISLSVLAAWTTALYYAGNMPYPNQHKSLINMAVVGITVALVGLVLILRVRDNRRLRRKAAKM